jgi:hypothetical protein
MIPELHSVIWYYAAASAAQARSLAFMRETAPKADRRTAERFRPCGFVFLARPADRHPYGHVQVLPGHEQLSARQVPFIV